MSLVTIFTAPKPFTNPHIAMIQRNAIRSWQALAPEVDILLLGEEEGLAETAKDLGVKHIPEIRRNSMGTPLISSMFELARQHSESPLLAIINTDVLLLPDFVVWAKRSQALMEKFVLMGQRWDLDVKEELSFNEGYSEVLKKYIHEKGRLHPRGGSDYFLFPRDCYTFVPDFAIGRAGWDNWMIYEARQQGWAAVDATGAIEIIHQDHDYSHLPGAQAHYRLPETSENIRLAGGKRKILRLDDCNYCVQHGQVKPFPLSWKKILREIEIFPLVKLHSSWLTEVFYLIFNPRKAYGEWRSKRSKN